MRHIRGRLSALLALSTMAFGCAATAPDRDFKGVQDAVAHRTTTAPMWPTSQEAEDAIDARVSALLAQPLDADAAVEIALLNNRRLRAEYARLGFAQADLLEASQLENPALTASAGFPRGAPGATAFDFGLTLNIVRLLTMPARQEIATAQVDAATLSVADEVIRISGQTRLLFLDVQAAENLSAMLRQIAVAADTSAELARRVQAAGNMSELALANHESLYEQARVDYARSAADAADLRERLNAQLGLWATHTHWSIVDHLPELPTGEPGMADLESLAIRQRLDLAAAAKEVEVLAKAAGLQRDWRSILTTDVGFLASRDTDGQWVLGPQVSIELPIFNQRQPEIARLDSARQQAEANLEALAIETRADVRRLRDRLYALRYEAEHYRDAILPLRHRITELTQREYNYMLVDTFDLLSARREEIAAYRSYLSTIHDYWATRAELERAVGGRLPADSTGSDAPTPASPAPAANDSEMQHMGDH